MSRDEVTMLIRMDEWVSEFCLLDLKVWTIPMIRAPRVGYPLVPLALHTVGQTGNASDTAGPADANRY